MPRLPFGLALAAMMATIAPAAPPRPSVSEPVVDATVAKLVAAHGAPAKPRAQLGVTQVAQRWFAGDGDDAAFTEFCTANFLTDESALTAQFARLETVLEQVD